MAPPVRFQDPPGAPDVPTASHQVAVYNVVDLVFEPIFLQLASALARFEADRADLDARLIDQMRMTVAAKVPHA